MKFCEEKVRQETQFYRGASIHQFRDGANLNTRGVYK